jgi:hypothetical protein
MPVEESSSHVNTKIKTNSSSNAQRMESHSIDMNNLSKPLRDRRSRDISISFDVSMTRKIQIAKYIAYLLILL